MQDSFKEPEELGKFLLTALHEGVCRGSRFADAKKCCGIGKEGATMVRDLLAANDVAWTLIDSGVVDEEWDLFNLFKEHRIKIKADATGNDHLFAPCARYRPTKVARTSSSTRSRRTRVAHFLAQR